MPIMQQIPRTSSSAFLPRPIAPRRLLVRSSHLLKANSLVVAGGRQHKRHVCFSSPSPWIPHVPDSHSRQESKRSLADLAPLEAILFDLDGTLCDSDPIHFHAWQESLKQIGFLAGIPISETFYIERISGGHNEHIVRSLFPEWDEKKGMDLLDKKEAMFRKLAPGKLQAVDGLHRLCDWIEDHGLKRALVSNAPKENAELMISLLGLTGFFQLAVLADDCDRAKPFPDPYVKALNDLDASPRHTLVFEDSASGIKAGVGAGMPVIGLTTRNPPQQLVDAGASLLIKNFEDPELWKRLEELVARPEQLI